MSYGRCFESICRSLRALDHTFHLLWDSYLSFSFFSFRKVTQRKSIPEHFSRQHRYICLRVIERVYRGSLTGFQVRTEFVNNDEGGNSPAPFRQSRWRPPSRSPYQLHMIHTLVFIRKDFLPVICAKRYVQNILMIAAHRIHRPRLN